MNETKERGDSILWIEAFGFSLLIVLSWLTEIVRIPHFVFGESFTPNWHRALLRTAQDKPLAVPADLHRPKKPELHAPSSTRNDANTLRRCAKTAE